MIGTHAKAVLQFSGGKDSLALLYLARPHLDRIEVHYGDTGAAFPHVARFVRETCDKIGASLKVIRPPVAIEAFQAEYGLPSDLLPVWNAKETAWTKGESGPLLQSTVSCCGAMLWQPLYDAARVSGATLVLRGTKECDGQKGVAPGFTHDGITYDAPLWGWSDADVLAYLKEQGAALPEHYGEVNSSLDCWLCTGHTTAEHAPDMLRYLAKRYPEYAPIVKERASAVGRAVNAETSKLNTAFAEIGA